MKTLGPGIGPSSKMDILQSLDKGNGPNKATANKGEPSPKIGEKKEFSDLVRERTPQDREAAKERVDRRITEARREKPNELRPSDRQKDSRPVKVESKGELPRQAENSGMTREIDRKKAMLEFMDSMQSEFGITPVRMLEAMAQIDSENLTLAPEDTASQVIDNLELAPEDEPRAMALYSSFINQWRELQDTPLKPMQMVEGGGEKAPLLMGKGMELRPAAKPEVSLTSVEKRAKLNESLDQMNARFFGKPEDGALPRFANSEVLRMAPELPANLMQKEILPSAQPLDATSTMSFTQDESGLYLAKPSTEGSIDFSSLPKMMPGRTELAPEVGLNKVTASELSEAESALGALIADVKKLSEQANSGSDEGFDTETSADSDLSDLAGPEQSHADLPQDSFAQVMRPQSFAGAPIAGAAVGTQSTGPTEMDKAALDAIKDQAQIMVNKGGGEAKITFNQEGLGEIQLKVVVHEGKVNVEMNAETQEAKKLLETSLSDLKTSLAQHKLAVDQVRVDVGSSNLSDSRQGMNFGQDLSRDHARQMMQQFRDETAGRRDPFMEMSGIKAYGKKMRGPDPIAPAPDVAVSRYSGEGRGNRMSLVA